MKTHALAKHNIKLRSARMERYVRQCLRLSQSSWRWTTKARILSLMGIYAQQKGLYKIVKRVLKGHLVGIKKRERNVKPCSEDQSEARSETCRTDFKNSRSQVRRGLSEHGFVMNFSGEKLCLLSRLYDQLRGKSDPAGPQLVHRVLAWAKQRGHSEVSAFYDPSLARDFHDEAKCILKPNSIRNHAQSMCSLIGHALTSAKLRPIFPITRRYRLKRARDEWQKIKNLNEREGRKQQRFKMKSTEFSPVPIFHVCQFLHDTRESGKIAQCFTLLENAINANGKIDSSHNEAYCLILCILALYLCLTGQRLCAALNLQLSEVFEAVHTEGVAVLKIRTHKTSRSMGPARIALKSHQYEDLLRFCKIRREMKLSEQSVLVTLGGKRPSNLMKPVDSYLRANCLSDQKITFNWFRSTIETCLHLSSLQSEAASDCVPAQLGHGVQVAKLHYRFQSDSATVSDSRRVENVLAQLVAFESVGKESSSWTNFSIPTTFRGNFPSRSELEGSMKENWTFRDLQLHSLSETSFEAIALRWRDLHREDLVETLADELKNCSSCAKWAVTDAFKFLPFIWNSEKNMLVPIIVQKIQSKV
ncbi:Phosphomethylpyrimidine synthase [Frankliniella fusca]|uniref:Phosphomethylpyrimidine synthase n=1 Tax=Frankliniella fusca TaxID=407009 RepID=A0AAE1HMZ0_9NEOP|nr:Phosphomethylpyrimidine synthase [Frankliniella fusca]